MPDRRRGWLSRLLTGAIVVAGALILVAGVAMRVADLRLQTVLSNSMRPTAAAGDLAVTQGVPAGSIRVGDVVAFIPPNGTRTVMHRVASLDGDVITTKGDANPVADPWHVALTGPIAYRLVAVVPFVGWLTELQRPAFLLAGLLVTLEVLLWLAKEVRARTTRRSAPQPQPQP